MWLSTPARAVRRDSSFAHSPTIYVLPGSGTHTPVCLNLGPQASACRNPDSSLGLEWTYVWVTVLLVAVVVAVVMVCISRVAGSEVRFAFGIK